ncbi:MAG: hypothetical protein Q9173_000913 [Seirophora scorigena]
MADRFPSLEEFGDGQTEPKSNGTANDGLDGDDFLTRERALLGDDAAQFSSANDNAATVEDGDDDLLGEGGGYDGGQGGGEEIKEEPEPIRLWREKRDADISRREEIASTKKTERVQKAQRDIDDFYENYNTKKDKSIARTRNEAKEFLENRQDTSSGGTSWERVAKLVDLSGKGAKGGAAGGGKEKFRELLMDLRKDEKAPGASGY